jgi:hypothetical protein
VISIWWHCQSWGPEAFSEPNIVYEKYKESAYVSLLSNPISQPSLDPSPIRIPVISEKVGKFPQSSV